MTLEILFPQVEREHGSEEVFIDKGLTDWGRAAYMASLSTDTDKIDEKLCSKVVAHLNTIRAGLNTQQEGIIMQ